MKKVAIVFYREVEAYHEYDHYGTDILVASQITEWTEVTDQEYSLLQKASLKKGFKVVSFPENQKEYIKKTVDDVLRELEEEKKKKEEEDAEKARKAAERTAKRLAKTEAERRALFEQLQKEFQK